LRRGKASSPDTTLYIFTLLPIPKFWIRHYLGVDLRNICCAALEKLARLRLCVRPSVRRSCFVFPSRRRGLLISDRNDAYLTTDTRDAAFLRFPVVGSHLPLFSGSRRASDCVITLPCKISLFSSRLLIVVR